MTEQGRISDEQRYSALRELGQAACRYRDRVYAQDGFSGQAEQPFEQVDDLLEDALAVIDRSLAANRRDDGLYHAYNLLNIRGEALSVDTLYPMLEGQVAVISAGRLTAGEVVEVLEALFDSEIYRSDQHSFMLYPDRDLPGFLSKNVIDDAAVARVPLLQRMLSEGDDRVVARDLDGHCRFNPDFATVEALNQQLDELAPEFGDELETARESIRRLYEQVFNHREFTGRSGTMFGYEGLGSVYWHMVSKLRLAAQENFWSALDQREDPSLLKRLGELYYRIREGLGFNKTPEEFGAFPTDPYSHTPRHAGARQPGMTGQVKEDVLCRFGELGIRVDGGATRIRPLLLRKREFSTGEKIFRFLDVANEWQELTVPAHGLAFTWCQVPMIYVLGDDAHPALTVSWADGREECHAELILPPDASRELFSRSGRIRCITAKFPRHLLFSD